MEKLSDKILTWCPIETLEQEAKDQLERASKLPFIFKHIALMPDAHVGKGCTIGSVIATKGAIIPACVGVDIGCGMVAVETNIKPEQLPDNLEKLRTGIERRIPLGAGGKNQKFTDSANNRIKILKDKTDVYYGNFAKWEQQLGSLGSGNHFIEICLDERDIVWVVLHSGSRGVGNRIADSHIKTAKTLMKTMMITLEDQDLAYLPEKTEAFDNYIRDLLWCQDYALFNREEMMDRVMKELSYTLFNEDGHQDTIEKDRINCHHNFTQLEHHFNENIWITRKGAIQMRTKDRGVIPGSMGTRSYIVSGLENKLSFNSAPHGAGRRMSRKKAKEQFTMEDFDLQMKGIECRRSESLIDELPSSYKDIEKTIELSKDLVKVEHTLKQILNVKGD